MNVVEENKGGGGLAERVGKLEAQVEAQGRELRVAIRRLESLAVEGRVGPEDAPVAE